MKAISIMQPWASLLVSGLKQYETRSWPAPSAHMGQRIAIASSKKNSMAIIDPALEVRLSQIPGFMRYGLLFGRVLGVVTLVDSIPMTAVFIAGLTEQERAFGHFEVGRYAWMFADAEPLAIAPPVRGKLGFYDWSPEN